MIPRYFQNFATNREMSTRKLEIKRKEKVYEITWTDETGRTPIKYKTEARAAEEESRDKGEKQRRELRESG